MSRGGTVFVTWTKHHRASELSRVLGARLYEPSPLHARLPAPIRYLAQIVQTSLFVLRHRPRSVLYTNPPFVAGAALLPLARLLRFDLWSDSHSGAFNDPRWTRFARADSAVNRRSRGVVVAAESLAPEVERREASPLVLNYPGIESRDRSFSAGAPYLVATVAYDWDEPIDALLEAARFAPDVEIAFTGRPPAAVVASAPANCRFTGFLPRVEYEHLLAGSRGVVCLTTREDTMQTGAYEAMQYGLPLLLSGTQALRSFFRSGAIFLDDHDPGTLAGGLRELWGRHEALSRDALAGRQELLDRCRHEVEQLREALG